MNEICKASGKEMFRTRAPAEKVLKAMNRKTHFRLGSVYRCKFCHQFHVTHWGYDDQTIMDTISETRPPSKKELRSQRNKIKLSKRPINYYIILKNLKMKRRCIFDHIKLISNDRKTIIDALHQLELATADIKNNMGICIGCTMVVYSDMKDHLKNLPQYKHEVKRAFNHIEALWKKWEGEAIHTPDSQTRIALFTLKEFDAKSQNVFKEGATDKDYFDLVMGTGGRAYVKSFSQMMCLRHKFYRLYADNGYSNAEDLSWLDLFGMLLQLTVDTFKNRTEQYRKDTLKLIIYPSPAQLFDTLNIEPIAKAYFQARDMLPHLPDLDDTTVRNLALTANDIREQWLSFENMVEHVNNACEDFDDVMASKAQIRKLKIENNKQLENFRKEQREKKLQQIQESLNKDRNEIEI